MYGKELMTVRARYDPWYQALGSIREWDCDMKSWRSRI